MDVLLKNPMQGGSALAGIRLKGASINKDGAAKFTGSGVFRDADAEKEIRSLFFDGRSFLACIEAPGAWTFTGQMRVVSLEYSGEASGHAAFHISLTTKQNET